MGTQEGKPDTGQSGKQERQGMNVKVYLVFLRSNVKNKAQGHERLLAAKLTRTAAEEVQQMNPGSYIHKIFATK